MLCFNQLPVQCAQRPETSTTRTRGAKPEARATSAIDPNTASAGTSATVPQRSQASTMC